MKSTEEIYNLITKHVSGELSASEQESLHSWLEESPENSDVLKQFKKVWELTKLNESLVIKKSVDEEWKRLQKKLEFNEKMNVISFFQKLRWTRYLSVAASIIAFVSLVFWFTQKNQNEYQIAETLNAETKELRLSDGSIIQMNNATQIRYRENASDSVRLVLLKGEAFFTVEKNKKPFVVQTDMGRVRVLGTKFNVWSRKKVTRVFVRKGKVSLAVPSDSCDQEKKIINPNQMAIAKDNQIEIFTGIQESGKAPGWLEGKIVFNQTELQEVVDELERIFDCKIILKQKDLADLSITANFNQRPIEDILKAVCLALDLKYRSENDGFVIYQ